ncbi:Cof-type HAD-IIB family hydrolase [Acidiphilium sp. AL]|uniref:Cof-type HAD-IIB family hydrolase n=1 Tax=Acidiphilium iwatense TaxID=768198 RepID=A0ABS9DWK7_9PROT|nr:MULTISPECIES: Cof-type HAD-IIB family hydrolase [Acidiphilium]MCF3945822.1 Cof-type HAD-IIB family hydrolase [Acidiphilium iwatense]MCU4161123.1 Cof-type HAD-IIB family hydrolase [Acidiphilium sp. AL]
MSRKIELVLADVDGTLVTNEKELTEGAKRAVADLHKAGIKFAITSGRPPRGMAMVSKPLGIDTPIAGFNGGVLIAPDLKTVIDSHDLPSEVIKRAIDLLGEHDLDAWVYTKRRWLVRDKLAPHVDREARTVQFDPEIIEDFSADDLKTVVKIVGVTDDHEKMQQALKAAQDEFGDNVAASCSQPYYLDITNAKANKGAVVDSLSRILKIEPDHIATIGDMPNDVRMFKRSGVSIAMGNADDTVKAHAKFATDSNEHDGFAKAIRRFVLDGDGA